VIDGYTPRYRGGVVCVVSIKTPHSCMLEGDAERGGSREKKGEGQGPGARGSGFGEVREFGP